VECDVSLLGYDDMYVITSIHNVSIAHAILLHIKLLLFVVYLTNQGRLLNTELKEAVVAYYSVKLIIFMAMLRKATKTLCQDSRSLA
jgi:hypothetical protein